MRKVSADNNRALKSRSVGVLVVAAAIAVTAVGCSVPGQGAGAAEAQLQVRAVRTEAVVKRDIGQPVEQVADVVALNVLDILPKASGEVLEVLRKRGEFVEKGDVLFRIDSRDAESAKRKSELALSSALESLQKAKDDRVNNRKDLADAVTRAEVALNNAEQDYNKMRNDFDAGKVTQHQVDQSKQRVDNARMSLESARSKLAANDNSNTIASIETQAESARISLEDATRNLDNYSVKAPASGLLTDFNVVAGQTVSMNGGKVGQVQQIDPVKIKTELSVTNYQLVKNKQQLTYYSPDAPDKKGTAAISYLAPVMSAQNKTFTLELEVPNADGALQPGARVMVQLTSDAEQQVVAVPTLSIVREESATYVFVQQGDQYQKRQVKLGRINGSYQEVLEGVKEGDQLVVTGQHTLKDGQKADTSKS